MNEGPVSEGKFDGIGDLVKSLHFEMDPKTAEEKKIELGKRQGEVTKRKQIEGGNYSLRRFRKEIKYWDGNKRDQEWAEGVFACLLYTSPSPRDRTRSRMPSSA